MRKLSLILVSLALVVAVVGCGGGGPSGSGLTEGYEDDFYPVDLTEEYGFELVHPGVGWTQTRDSSGDLRWAEESDEGEFRIRVTAGVQNPYQDRVDMTVEWEVIETEEIEFSALDEPVLFVHAWKEEEGFEYGALQLSFSRHFRDMSSAFYYIITLWNYDYTFHADYEEIMQEVIDTLVIHPE